MRDEKEVVAYLGPEGTYCHQATLHVFPAPKYKLHACITIEDVFAAVEDQTAQHGVVPFENSTNGAVFLTFDLFARSLHTPSTTPSYPHATANAETFLPIRHSLAVHPSCPATPTDLSSIRSLHSHPQVWTQCGAFLRSRLPAAEQLDASSTSAAAALVASYPASSDAAGREAALCGRMAAEARGLRVVLDGVQDRGDNVTRFLVLGRSSRGSPEESSEGSPEGSSKGLFEPGAGKGEKRKALLSFTVPHASPGALADALAVFKARGVNLTSLHTRPAGVVFASRPWEYVFFVEVALEGTTEVEELVQGLEGMVRDLWVCGVWGDARGAAV